MVDTKYASSLAVWFESIRSNRLLRTEDGTRLRVDVERTLRLDPDLAPS